MKANLWKTDRTAKLQIHSFSQETLRQERPTAAGIVQATCPRGTTLWREGIEKGRFSCFVFHILYVGLVMNFFSGLGLSLDINICYL